MWKKFVKDDSGATAVEYALIIAVLSLAIVAGINSFGNSMQAMFVDTASVLDNQ